MLVSFAIGALLGAAFLELLPHAFSNTKDVRGLAATVLGGILLDPDAIGRVADVLQPEAFYLTAHREIYRTALMLHSQGKPTDLTAMTAWLADTSQLEKVGGSGRLVAPARMQRPVMVTQQRVHDRRVSGAVARQTVDLLRPDQAADLRSRQ